VKGRKKSPSGQPADGTLHNRQWRWVEGRKEPKREACRREMRYGRLAATKASPVIYDWEGRSQQVGLALQGVCHAGCCEPRHGPSRRGPNTSERTQQWEHTERMGLPIERQGSNEADKREMEERTPWEQSAAFHWLGGCGPLHTSLLRRETG
jgi:hypothetical protein